jgi:hypothetical protein
MASCILLEKMIPRCVVFVVYTPGEDDTKMCCVCRVYSWRRWYQDVLCLIQMILEKYCKLPPKSNLNYYFLVSWLFSIWSLVQDIWYSKDQMYNDICPALFPKILKLFDFSIFWLLSVPDEDYSRNYYDWVDASPDRLFVPESTIHPVDGVSPPTWFLRYIYYWNLQFLNYMIINQTNINLPRYR